MSTLDLLQNINREDQTVALSVEKEIPAIEAFVNACSERMAQGGRTGAGVAIKLCIGRAHALGYLREYRRRAGDFDFRQGHAFLAVDLDIGTVTPGQRHGRSGGGGEGGEAVGGRFEHVISP